MGERQPERALGDDLFANYPGATGPEGPEESPDSDEPPPPSVEVRNWGMNVKHRPVFGGVDLQLPDGALGVILGPAGSGKTALLLSLSGRMAATEGTGEVLGKDLRKYPARVRKQVALANVSGITDLENNLTVAQHIAERLIMVQPWYRPPWVSRRAVGATVERIQRGFDDAARLLEGRDASRLEHFGREDTRVADFVAELSDDTFVNDLTPLQRFFLQIGLALIEGAPVLAVDNLDLLRHREDRERVWAGLCLVQRLMDDREDRGPLTILVSCEDSADLQPALDALGPGLVPPVTAQVRL